MGVRSGPGRPEAGRSPRAACACGAVANGPPRPCRRAIPARRRHRCALFGRIFIDPISPEFGGSPAVTTTTGRVWRPLRLTYGVCLCWSIAVEASFKHLLIDAWEETQGTILAHPEPVATKPPSPGDGLCQKRHRTAAFAAPSGDSCFSCRRLSAAKQMA